MYRVEAPGLGPVKGGFESIEAAIVWAHNDNRPRYMIWDMGAAMYVHCSWLDGDGPRIPAGWQAIEAGFGA